MWCFRTLPGSAARFQAPATMRQNRANYAKLYDYYQIWQIDPAFHSCYPQTLLHVVPWSLRAETEAAHWRLLVRVECVPLVEVSA